MTSTFAQRLIRWQSAHGRHDLPWQGADAYHVWLSEIMLQQTQVATVLPYYRRFIAAFPNIAALSAATEEQVLAHWSGLGYYARGRNLHAAARIIMEKHHGEFPREFERILELPGIGRSTAAAICALAWHERRAILDGNVKRVLARHCGIAGSPGKALETRLWQLAEALLPQRDIAVYIQAQMDLGATLCTRSRPKCDMCPVHSDCVAYQSGRVSEFPAPRLRKAVPERHATFLLLLHGNDILLEKRPGSGIWGGLWCPPQFVDEAAALAWGAKEGMNIAYPGSGGEKALEGKVSGNGYPSDSKIACVPLRTFAHSFTHFKLHITPLLLRLQHRPKQVREAGSVWLDVGEALRAGIPQPVRALLEEYCRS
ncbi:MAG TPA: A/G-specific adenine glycosylase [Gallionella sp.]|nr:A/G-specific adenine glycosylase [Gallionella sp.]